VQLLPVWLTTTLLVLLLTAMTFKLVTKGLKTYRIETELQHMGETLLRDAEHPNQHHTTANGMVHAAANGGGGLREPLLLPNGEDEDAAHERVPIGSAEGGESNGKLSCERPRRHLLPKPYTAVPHQTGLLAILDALSMLCAHCPMRPLVTPQSPPRQGIAPPLCTLRFPAPRTLRAGKYSALAPLSPALHALVGCRMSDPAGQARRTLPASAHVVVTHVWPLSGGGAMQVCTGWWLRSRTEAANGRAPAATRKSCRSCCSWSPCRWDAPPDAPCRRTMLTAAWNWVGGVAASECSHQAIALQAIGVRLPTTRLAVETARLAACSGCAACGRLLQAAASLVARNASALCISCWLLVHHCSHLGGGAPVDQLGCSVQCARGVRHSRSLLLRLALKWRAMARAPSVGTMWLGTRWCFWHPSRTRATV
jgi:hypothetical protein